MDSRSDSPISLVGDNPHHAVPSQNRLTLEKSPYLLQHAKNPVDWYAWGEEAFKKARVEDKPIFLSIGYSTCHWCHVMARESFEDAEVAELMNATFVNVKVDREERPDIDHVYMTVCQLLTGSGGWPLTIVMTAEQKPFFAGTYFPRESQFGRIGMKELIPKLEQLWRNHRQEALNSADVIMNLLQKNPLETTSADEMELSLTSAETAYLLLKGNFDEQYGGFGYAPKFPMPHQLLFLLRYWHRTGDRDALSMVEKTLQTMRWGGIYDHVGFGFARYSTDTQWLVPHFEKMLYDQALLALVYTEAYLATGKPEYRKTAEEIFTYVLRDLTSPEGGFYCAEDADSEGIEGKFYLWTKAEIADIVGEDEADLFCRVYQIERDGNFTDPFLHGQSGVNILHLSKPWEELAADLKLSAPELIQRMETARVQLFAARQQRIHPHKDDKILTDWNGLMIAALAQGASAFGEPRYARAAAQAARFVLDNLRSTEGRLLHRYRNCSAGIPAHLNDFAFLSWGLIELYQTTFDPEWLQRALELNQIMWERFRDEERGGYYFSADDAEELPVRYKEVYDGAVPSGNSVAVYNLLRLARLTGQPELENQAGQILRTFAAQLNSAPTNHTALLTALEYGLAPALEVVIVGDPEAEDSRAMLRALNQRYLPNKVVLSRPVDASANRMVQIVPFIEDMLAIGGKATAYVCTNQSCNFPTNEVDEFMKMVGGN